MGREEDGVSRSGHTGGRRIIPVRRLWLRGRTAPARRGSRVPRLRRGDVRARTEARQLGGRRRDGEGGGDAGVAGGRRGGAGGRGRLPRVRDRRARPGGPTPGGVDPDRAQPVGSYTP